MFKTIDKDDDNRLDAGEVLVMVSAAMETEIGAELQTAKEVLEGARDEFGECIQQVYSAHHLCDFVLMTVSATSKIIDVQ